jgi:hypothetical protein
MTAKRKNQLDRLALFDLFHNISFLRQLLTTLSPPNQKIQEDGRQGLSLMFFVLEKSVIFIPNPEKYGQTR